MPLLSLDEKLFGRDTMEKPVPQPNDNCLIFDGEQYIVGLVSKVDLDTKTYEAETPTGTTFFNMHICRFRPI